MIKIFPKDEWGRIHAIIIGRYSLVWEWPTGKMLWFMWGKYNCYRLGPVTFSIDP